MYTYSIFLLLNIISSREQLNNELNFVDLFDYLSHISMVYYILLKFNASGITMYY